MNHEPAAVNARFAALYTGAVTDVLDELGLRTQALPHELRPSDPTLRLSGRAYTIEGCAQSEIDYDASMTSILQMLAAVPSGYVATYQPGDHSCSHLGELSVVALKARGCVGAVIDGGCRDVGHILSERFPVFCRYYTPLDAVSRWEVLAHGNEITIGDVHIATGDQLVGDRDGVVVVPSEVREEVLVRAEEVVGVENLVREAVKQGVSPFEAYQRHGRF